MESLHLAYQLYIHWRVPTMKPKIPWISSLQRKWQQQLLLSNRQKDFQLQSNFSLSLSFIFLKGRIGHIQHSRYCMDLECVEIVPRKGKGLYDFLVRSYEISTLFWEVGLGPKAQQVHGRRKWRLGCEKYVLVAKICALDFVQDQDSRSKYRLIPGCDLKICSRPSLFKPGTSNPRHFQIVLRGRIGLVPLPVLSSQAKA